MSKFNFRTTKEIAVDKQIINQVVGQESAVKIIKKAALQRRHVLLIGEPGTGKSMLGLALAELLPKEKLVDILSFINPNDENQPMIRTVKAGEGRDITLRSKLQNANAFKNQSTIMLIVVLAVSLLPYWMWKTQQITDIIFAASMITGVMFIIGFMLFLNMGQRASNQVRAPRTIVDNFKKEHAPFFDATGAHAGALLGDVLHDPFQTFLAKTIIFKRAGNKFIKAELSELDSLFMKFKETIIRKPQNNYEAIHLPKNELLIFGETNNQVSPVEVLSCNRYDYDGKMIKLKTSDNKELIVTPEHKIAVKKDNYIDYVEAQNLNINDELVVKSENLIIDEQDIINTYDERQQQLAKSYSDYLRLKQQDSSWGYKRIATKLGVSYGRTRWWSDHDSAPVPVQTIDWLKQKGLLPLTIDNPKLPLIAKVLGTTFGDGGIFENLNGIFLSSSEKAAVEEFGRDIEAIFGLGLNENSRIIEGGEYGHSWCYQNTNRNIIRFFLALGAPKGNKTKINLLVPEWLKLNATFEKEFYGSYLGNELGTPTIHKAGNYLTTLEVGITGTPEFKQNRLTFLNQLREYLHRNDVSCTSIYEGKSPTPGSLVFRLLVEKKMDNVLHFMINVKLNYCNYKIERLYQALGKWTQLKISKYNELLQRGYGAEHAMGVLNLTPNSLYLILNHFEKAET
ncbi:MAG: ATP-binding protein [Candidatus Woesearchaeota archaeon]